MYSMNYKNPEQSVIQIKDLYMYAHNSTNSFVTMNKVMCNRQIKKANLMGRPILKGRCNCVLESVPHALSTHPAF